MQFSITYRAKSAEEFESLFAKYGTAIKAPRVRRTREEIKSGIPLDALKGIEVEPGTLPDDDGEDVM